MRDTHGRDINYVRLAVTDRCNMRCFYCMPQEGIKYIDRQLLMSYEEMNRLIYILYREGFRKLRITGGEPFLRKDLITFLSDIARYDGLKIHITTNATLIDQYLDQLIDLGIKDINVSLDAIDKEVFEQITRSNTYDRVMQCLHQMIAMNFHLKINMVVMSGINESDIVPMALLAKDYPLEVRFLEEMPFNGAGFEGNKQLMNYQDIKQRLSEYMTLDPLVSNEIGTTATTYQVAGWKGTLGIIPSYSRTFCGTCNRLRVTPQGDVRTCLYDEGIFNIRDLMRSGATDQQVVAAIQDAITHKAIDGRAAESNRSSMIHITESMSTIGG